MNKTNAKITGRQIRIPNALRQELEEAIETHLLAVERLTAVLDKADGDADLEPSLGSQDGMLDSTNQESWSHSALDDRERDVGDEPHDEADEGNAEPSLAHTNDLNQERAQKTTVNHGNSWISQSLDLEAEHDGREPCCEDEGAQCEDEGAQCEDEGAEERVEG